MITEKLTKPESKKISKLLEKGISNADIQEIFNYNVTRQQIAAIKAWKTMGKIY
jgi:hypothetical protein